MITMDMLGKVRRMKMREKYFSEQNLLMMVILIIGDSDIKIRCERLHLFLNQFIPPTQCIPKRKGAFRRLIV
jgi:hypothetical protein